MKHFNIGDMKTHVRELNEMFESFLPWAFYGIYSLIFMFEKFCFIFTQNKQLSSDPIQEYKISGNLINLSSSLDKLMEFKILFQEKFGAKD